MLSSLACKGHFDTVDGSVELPAVKLSCAEWEALVAEVRRMRQHSGFEKPASPRKINAKPASWLVRFVTLGKIKYVVSM